jgi:hypothetical protein
MDGSEKKGMKNELLLPLDSIKSLSGWSEIERAEQSQLLDEIKGLESQMIAGAQSRITVGKHLAAIQEHLAPRKMFNQFLRAYNFKRSTAFKAITSYKNASQWLPPHILEAAAARNMNMLGEQEDAPVGVYSNCVRRLPPQTGVSTARSIEPQAPPEEFIRGAGRPKTIEGTAA